MKKLYYYIPLLLGVMLYACKNDVPAIVGFEADTSVIEAEAIGGEYYVTIRSEMDWVAEVEQPWVMFSPANGRGETRCLIKIDSALMDSERKTDIDIRYIQSNLDKSRTISITQKGFERSIVTLKRSTTDTINTIDIASSAIRADRWVEFDVATTVKFKVLSGADWIEVDDDYIDNLNLDRGMRPRTTRVRLDWKMNSESKERVETLRFISDDADTLELATINIRQAAGPRIENNREGDSLAVITIFEKLECWGDNGISSTENMSRWDCVRLWEATDKSLPTPEAVGRVRDLDLKYFNTEDGVPVEVKHLKYLETLSLFGNVNTMLKSIDLCPEVAELEYLKDLRIAAFGLVSLPANFWKLGDTLESLDLHSNNFNAIPAVINKEVFKHLKKLNLASNRRASITDLRDRETANENGIGMYANMDESDVVKNLFLWEALEELALSYNYIEGKLPDFKDMPAYSSEDLVKYGGDTVELGKLPRILPNMRSLKINLNFMTGDLPDWLIYHPRFLEWGPEVLIFPQQEKSVNSKGNRVGFNEVPTSFEFYFKKYPSQREKYEFNEEME